MMPIYVAVVSALTTAAMRDLPRAHVAPGWIVGLTAAALLVFLAASVFIDRWMVRREAAHLADTPTGTARSLIDGHPIAGDWLEVVVGAPRSQAVGYLVGFITSGVVGWGLQIGAVLIMDGFCGWLQIPINVLAYTALFTTATFLNARTASRP